MSGFFANLLALANTWLQSQTLASGKSIFFAGGSGNGAICAKQHSIAADASITITGLSTGLLHMRQDASGGALLCGYDGTTVYSIHQNGTNFTIGADPGSGSGKIWVQNSGVITNRNSGTVNLSVLLLSSAGGTMP